MRKVAIAALSVLQVEGLCAALLRLLAMLLPTRRLIKERKLTKSFCYVWCKRLVELIRADHTHSTFRAYSAPEQHTHVVDAIMPARWVVFHT